MSLFDYNRKVDLDPQVIRRESRGQIVIQDLVFVGIPGKEGVKAYLISPPNVGPMAGLLWLHWLGEKHSNRSQYLEEAIRLAPKGAISLLIEAMWSSPEWYEKRIPEKDYENSIRQVIEIRRAIDLLARQPNVDPARIGMIGHDFGGMYGAMAAAMDPRVKFCVFVALTSSLSHWAFFGPQPKSKVDYLRQNAVFEITDYLAALRAEAVFFQFSSKDRYISLSDTSVTFGATGAPKQRKMYDADHSMSLEAITADRDDWLISRLRLQK